jgi:hypothetical protein
MNLLGQWCSPTREITNTRLIRLIDESRQHEAAAEVVHEAPGRLENELCNGIPVDLQSLDDPDAPASAQEVVAPDPGLPTLESEPEVEPATEAFMYAPMTQHAMPPTTASAQHIATGARRSRQRVARTRILLGLGALMFLCLGLLVALGLAAWDAADASRSVSLGM